MGINTSVRELLEGQRVASSRLSVALTDELMSEGLLIPVVRGSKKSYRARDVEALKRYLVGKNEHNRLFELSINDSSPRASQASLTGNSKLTMTRSCPGFLINTYEPILCRLNGNDFLVNPTIGSFLFVADWNTFEIPDEVIVVGIENMENFRLIRQQRSFFESEISTSLPLLFVSRYPQSTDLRNWLGRIPNRYVHFGDFDLAGINIFLTEFHRYLGKRSTFLIPSDIEQRLAIGSSKRYDDHFSRFSKLTTDEPSLNNLIETIHRYRKCYDQEGYIEMRV